jgi:DNA segregation ATPase FtsK/SpoIIIE-like protein
MRFIFDNSDSNYSLEYSYIKNEYFKDPNLPSRLLYKVGQKIDSKIILDSMGAESLLGRGDMLFTPPGMPGLVRIHAPWSTETEIEKVVEFLKDQREIEYSFKRRNRCKSRYY